MSLDSDTRLLLLGAFVVVGGGGLVALVGLERAAERPVPGPTAAPAASGAAPSYRDLRNGRRGPNAWMYRSVSAELAEPLPGLDEPVVPSAADWSDAVAARRARRAYDGAPPTVPHATSERTLDCVGCHGAGAVVEGKVAPRMSHAPYPSCTQCHVAEATARAPSPDVPPAIAVENTFDGLASPGRGTRAWPGAPPTIPHATQMRSECTSCHGPTGKRGLRSPHLEQASCTQCHAPAAARDQRPPWVAGEGTSP